MRKKFENYVIKHWENGYASPKWFRVRGEGRYISRKEAGAILGMHVPTLNNLISKGKLKGLIRRSGRRSVSLVEAASVETLRRERERYLTLQNASKLLGMKQLDVLRLVDNSLLNAARGPSIDNHDTWQFEKNTIDDFLATVFTRIVKFKPRLGNDLRSLNDILVSLTKALSSMGWGPQQLVKDILDGVIAPRGETPSKSGLARLLFTRQEIEHYLEANRRGNPDETFQLPVEGRGLPFKPGTLHFLARKKLIETTVKTHKGLRCRTITPEALLFFTSKYVAASKVPREAGTRTDSLIQVLKSHKIYPISGPSIDCGPQYFFRRTDLANLNLIDLVTAWRLLCPKKRMRSHTVDKEPPG